MQAWVNVDNKIIKHVLGNEKDDYEEEYEDKDDSMQTKKVI